MTTFQPNLKTLLKHWQYILGWVDYGHFYLRPKRGLALDLYEYNTPLGDLKFNFSLKPVGDHIQLYSFL